MVKLIVGIIWGVMGIIGILHPKIDNTQAIILIVGGVILVNL